MIYIDTREPPKIAKYATEYGLVYEQKELPIGDILSEEKSLCIERKDILDLINSLRSGHLDKQLMQMEAAFEHPYLLISGTPEDVALGGHVSWTTEHHTGLLKHLLVRFPKLKIAQVRNDHQLVLLAKKLIEATGDGKKVDVTKTELFRLAQPEDPEDVHAMMLTAIPNIGIKTARSILKVYPFFALNFVSEDGLCGVDGIGMTIAKRIKKYFPTQKIQIENLSLKQTNEETTEQESLYTKQELPKTSKPYE